MSASPTRFCREGCFERERREAQGVGPRDRQGRRTHHQRHEDPRDRYGGRYGRADPARSRAGDRGPPDRQGRSLGYQGEPRRPPRQPGSGRRDHDGRDRHLGTRHHLRGRRAHDREEARRLRGDLQDALLRGDRGRRDHEPGDRRGCGHQARGEPAWFPKRGEARRGEAPRPRTGAHRIRASQASGKRVEMEREPLSSEADALWRRLWEIWQDNDEEDVVLDSGELADLEEEIPGLENRMKTALASLQRARYIQYRPGVGEDGLEPILYDVYEPR